ncbi:TetR/AcrR family transcriptional regulator [Permianibacter sp. IMCC34836]|uniref:TetR/AcrR family transcriptional regulator n=1 Tax=Permianibacter fluminis TaxID=2738515 RepID=UPI0015533C6F|nr:TetR/AcrR family transcriptional regulator [Permianibacter fluminis]NQD35852.1 TetR/AcrR family transcriptional regulator [Permianibacter fluminis]
MSKGEQTRQHILGTALGMARERGLEGLTIGSLADGLAMSKSGVFAHFGSKEELQIAVLKEAAERFAEQVLRPALAQPRGVARVRAILQHWLAYSVASGLPGGCLFIAAAAEFDDKPGPVRDFLQQQQSQWRLSLLKAIQMAVDAGELPAETDPEQFGFELFALVLASHHDQRLLGETQALGRAQRGFERLLAYPPLHLSH